MSAMVVLRRPVCLLLLLCTLPVAAQTADARELYLQAVHILGGNGNVVSRWDGPIRFTVIGGGGETAAQRIVSEAASIAGLELQLPENKATTVAEFLGVLESTPPYALGRPCAGSANEPCFNFVAVLASPQELRALAKTIPLPAEYERLLSDAESLHCFFAPFRDSRRRIRQVVIYVRHDLDSAMKQTCFQEEIYQSFGLFGDVTGSKLFSFNNVVAPKQITRYDRALLASLYDPQVKPGYPVHHVATIFVESLEIADGE